MLNEQNGELVQPPSSFAEHVAPSSSTPNRTCPICLQDMEAFTAEQKQTAEPIALEEQELRELHCGHLFHKECILHWFQSSNTKRCPVCRYDEERGFAANDTPVPSSLATTTNLPRVLDVTDFDLDLDDLFGNFQTEDGGSVFIYEGPRGIIMVRMLNVNIPARTHLVRARSPPTTRAITRTVRRMLFSRTRSFFRRVWNKFRACLV